MVTGCGFLFVVSGFGIESIEYRKVRRGGAKDVGEIKVRGGRFEVGFKG